MQITGTFAVPPLNDRWMNKRLLLLWIMLCCACTTWAQNRVPASGIYYLDKNKNQYFDPAHYMPYLYRIDDFFEVNIKPHADLFRAGLEYALVAVNSKEHKVRVALLRDTVSKNAKAISKRLGPGSVSYANGPYYACAYTIAGDSLVPAYTSPYFPDKIELEGTWVSGADYLGVFKYPGIEQITIPDTLTKEYRNGRRYTFEQSFYQHRGNKYVNLEYLLHYDHPVPVYTKPEQGAKEKTRFVNGEIVAVVSDTVPGWYLVDRIMIQPDTHPRYGVPPGGSRLEYISGWVREEDLVANAWVKQKEQTPLYRFEVSGYEDGQAYSGEKGNVDAVKVIDKKTGKTLQVIANIGATLETKLEDAVMVIDFNFDGYPDFMLYYQNGGAGPNNSWNFYTYNPASRRFVYNDTLSALSQVEIDLKTKTISCAWRSGAGIHGAERYQYINGTLTRTYFWEQTFGMGYFAQEETGQLADGHWQEQTLQGAELVAPSVSIYEQPEEKGTGRVINKAGDDAFQYFLIEEETPLWYKVKYEDVVYSHGATGNNNTTAYRPQYTERRGWMRKEAVLPQQWYRQPQVTPLYFFEITDSSQLIAVRIVDRATGKARQIITSNNQAAVKKDSVLVLADYNFDGHIDFSFATMQEGNDEIKAYSDFYIYDTTAALFVKDTLLAALPNLRFNPETQTATSSAIEERKTGSEIKTYQYIAGTWKLIYTQVCTCPDPAQPCKVTEKKWLQGKWEERVTEQKRATLFPE